MPSKDYCPRRAGALCDYCPLKSSVVVPPESPSLPEITVIAESPGTIEMRLERPLIGPAGMELGHALEKGESARAKVHLTQVIQCKPPGGNLKVYLAKLRSLNKGRKAKGQPLIPSPIDCCRPRLLNEVMRGPSSLLLLGTYAAASFGKDGGDEKKLMGSRGFPDRCEVTWNGQERTFKTLRTVHPSLVLRQNRWRSVFQGDVAKAIRMSRNTLRPFEPQMVYEPTPDQLANILAHLDETGKIIAYDVETDGIEPLTANLRCVGIGTHELVTCTLHKSVEGRVVPHVDRINEVLCNFFEQKGIVAAHNVQYDKTVMENQVPHFNQVRANFDTIMAHQLCWSELPHNLAFVSAQYTDLYAHKEVNHAHWDSDRELHKYCMYDVAVTSYAAEQMLQDPKFQAQKKAFQSGMEISEFCRDMHTLGITIDTKERDRLWQVKNDEMAEAELRFNRLALEALPEKASIRLRRFASELNPGSKDQVAKYLFQVCGIEPIPGDEGGITDTGAPSVARPILYALIDRGLPSKVEKMILALIDYKEAQKIRGTYCTVEPGFDGRVHASWNPHGTVSGRLSCSGPNLMNLPKSIKTMYVAAPGHLLVACDKAQLEARITAWLAKEETQIKVFLEGGDIHKVNACAVLEIPSVDQVTAKERQFTKTFVYAIQYLASCNKAWRMVRVFRDKKGNRPYADLPFSKTEASYRAFWEDRVKTKSFHATNREFFARHGYLADVIHGRRRYFLDGNAGGTLREELANYIIQSTASADVNEATKRLRARFPRNFDGHGTGIVLQCHDSLTIECREENAMSVGREMVQIMNSMLGDMPLPVDCQIGPNIGDMDEITFDEEGGEGNE
jgi:uracil-DNA glycosylase family 4